ncbi:IMP 5'-nucleotidase NDAI_0C01230 [Naumovozyma dairenensis CBS 421]|uniref:IMP-specific 5'-nucleotidase 1 n=1 Tax=Naumovozyma dairenensis (strain ATCC 10597 / BCRC 20456 / CBS 421 / NBRC 0211 / NRRL Y-12639) TaxID=1071378 RepID=G0W7M3_NAUDC|nr:hypothetical protein NDAI_0C01230 [Naumovozyma dairenensis CBS 421]CCD23784.1 hypothetical protein NDAI_0C01230 [Naumovozyma dairenensis CBS 421]
MSCPKPGRHNKIEKKEENNRYRQSTTATALIRNRKRSRENMSSRYRVEYHLKSHRKDEFIDWIKGLLAAPFVLHAISNISSQDDNDDDLVTTQRVKSQYADIFKDIERLIQNKIEFDQAFQNELENTNNDEEENANNDDSDAERGDVETKKTYAIMGKSRLNLLVPSIGTFFTELPLEEAFLSDDYRKRISARRMVAPSFNDIRNILNTAQILHFIKQRKIKNGNRLKLVTFDGDVTLYEDGGSLFDTNPVIPYILKLLKCDIRVGIVTAAGYDDASTYERRLKGLINALHNSESLTVKQKSNLTIMGGESNYLFRYYENEDQSDSFGFIAIEKEEWMLPVMEDWSQKNIEMTLDFAERTLTNLKRRLNIPKEVPIIRKKRAVGIVPGRRYDERLQSNVPVKLAREQLEEIVLTLQNNLESFPPSNHIQFSCFDGGSDVWCDIGGKNLGITTLQHYYDPTNPIKPRETLHVGDQFAPMGSANDFKARLAGCTLWIASPQETVDILHRLIES